MKLTRLQKAVNQYCKDHDLKLKFKHTWVKGNLFTEAFLVTKDAFHDIVASGFSKISREAAVNDLAQHLFEHEILSEDGRKVIHIEEISDSQLKMKFAILGK